MTAPSELFPALATGRVCRTCEQPLDADHKGAVCWPCRLLAKRDTYNTDPHERALQLARVMNNTRGPGVDPKAAAAMLVRAPACHYCAFPQYAGIPFGYDHRVPVSSGGPHTLDNLVPCCAVCNRAKNNLPPDLYELWMAHIKGGAAPTPDTPDLPDLPEPATMLSLRNPPSTEQ